ncbi:HET-domain-containing protein, partial [Cadophora sp. DSE1049]
MSSRCYIYTVAGSSASQKWPHIDSRPSIDQNAVSEGTLGRAASWLKHCIENHPDCGAVEEVELPTRLIKLGDSGGNPQLVITCGMRGKYATLSHCWGSPGSPRPLTTTGPTLDARMAGVSFNDLPRTFQDAIAVTRGLGLNYLWIDSLCIIQESREDWTKESQEMQNVYANAVFNISADSASDSSMGLGRTGDLNL